MSKLQRVATMPRQSLVAMKVALGARAPYTTVAAIGLVMLTQILGVVIFSGKVVAYTADEFVTTWKTDNPGTSEANQIVIPTEGEGYNYTVDWGDGDVTSGHTEDATHTYASPGTYTVAISGDFPRIHINHYGDREKLVSIEQWGTNPWVSMDAAFAGAKYMTLNAADNPDLTNVTSMAAMFRDAESLNSDINDWDVSNVTDMTSLFGGARQFNQPLNNWDTSSVIDMSGMFNGFYSILTGNNWNIGMESAFNQPLDNWDTSSVLYMNGMFSGAASFNQNINNWDVSNVNSIRDMFSDAVSFNQPLDNWDTSSVVNMLGTFSWSLAGDFGYDMMIFNQPLNSWNTSSVTDMSSMFAGNTVFNQPLNNWNTSSVTTMRSMFYVWGNHISNGYTSTFNQPLDNWDTSNVTDMRSMFDGALSFNQPLNSWDVSNVTEMNSMFQNARVFNQPLNNWNTSNVTDMGYIFSAATAFNQPLNTWDVSSVTSLSGAFISAAAFNQSLSAWDVSNVTNTESTFGGARSFNQPLNTWDTSNVTDMSGMFAFATSFDQSLSSWDVSNVTDMRAMFLAAPFSRSLANWDITSVTQMDNMFGNYDAYVEQIMGSTPYEDWPQEAKDLYGLPKSYMSPADYDATLASWSQLTLHNGVIFTAGTATEYCNASEARQKIITLFNWTIQDGGNACLPGNEPEVEEPEEPIVDPGVELPFDLEPEEPTISDATSVPETIVKPPFTPIKTPKQVASSQNSLFALAKRIPEPFAIGFPWLLLVLAFTLVAVQYYQVHSESVATARTQKGVAHQKQLVEEQNNFVALSTHYLHTPLTVMEGEISLMVKAGTLTQAQASKLKATLASLSAEAEATLAQEDQNE